MPTTRTEWARAKDAPEYHSVTFVHAGPNIHEETARCGMVGRFWPRIGVRMNDSYCEECVRIVAAESDEAMHDFVRRKGGAMAEMMACSACRSTVALSRSTYGELTRWRLGVVCPDCAQGVVISAARPVRTASDRRDDRGEGGLIGND
jgi:hypothetical protein